MPVVYGSSGNDNKPPCVIFLTISDYIDSERNFLLSFLTIPD